MKKTIDRLQSYIDEELKNPKRDSMVWIARWRLAIERVGKDNPSNADILEQAIIEANSLLRDISSNKITLVLAKTIIKTSVTIGFTYALDKNCNNNKNQ